ncbi:MAG: hypothetical protein EHM42_02560, partial [Planctomycetaceae bacterium]
MRWISLFKGASTAGTARTGVLALIVLTLGSGLAGAQQKSRPKSAEKPAEKTAGKPAGKATAVLSSTSVKAPDPDADEDLDLLARDEVVSWLESIGAAVDDGKLDDFNRHIDWEALSATASRGFQIPPKSKGKFLSEFRAAQDEDSGFSGQVIRAASKGGSYALLRVHEVGTEMRALFRIVLPEDAGFNYHDYVLKRVGNAIKAVDVYIYGAGEMLTSTMRRAMIISAATQGPDWLKGLSGRDLDMARAAKVIREYSELAAKPDPEAVLAIYAKLPPKVQTEKGVLLVRLYAAMQIDAATEQKAIADIRKADPNDVAGDMLCLSTYLGSQRYDLYQKVVARLNKIVGGDPYLNVVKASMHVERKEFAEARKLLKDAIEADDTLSDAWWSLVTVSLRDQSFSETVTCLDKLATEFGVDVGDLTRNPEYADFVKSREYSQW